jgi:hypothetical protein
MIEKDLSYTKSSALLFWPLFGRMVNSQRAFEGFGANILGVIVKRRCGRNHCA